MMLLVSFIDEPEQRWRRMAGSGAGRMGEPRAGQEGAARGSAGRGAPGGCPWLAAPLNYINSI